MISCLRVHFHVKLRPHAIVEAPVHRHCKEKAEGAIMITSLKIAAGFGLFLAASAAMAADGPTLETVAVLEHAPGNIAVTTDGTVIVSVHPAFSPQYTALAITNGEARSYPPGDWSTVLDEEPTAGQHGFRPVLGVRAGQDGLLWMISGGSGQAIKHLYAWDTNTDTLAHDFQFSAPEAAANSFYNDIALAPDHNTIFISDPAGSTNAAIVAVDLTTGTAKRLLEGHASVQAEAIAAYIDGKMLGFPSDDGETQPLRGALNPITIDAEEEWLYYAPMSGLSVYRIRVRDLLDYRLSAEQLADRVERYADKPASAGITIDDSGNVYVTDIQANAVGAASPDGYHIVVQDPVLLSWPDGLSTGPDGYIYVASNSLFKNFPSHSGDGPPKPPFYITRFKALGPTTAGR